MITKISYPKEHLSPEAKFMWQELEYRIKNYVDNRDKTISVGSMFNEVTTVTLEYFNAVKDDEFKYEERQVRSNIRMSCDGRELCVMFDLNIFEEL